MDFWEDTLYEETSFMMAKLVFGLLYLLDWCHSSSALERRKACAHGVRSGEHLTSDIARHGHAVRTVVYALFVP